MAKVVIDDAYDVREATRVALVALGVDRTLRPGARVFLKPNLTYPSHRPGITTSPHFLRAVLECFVELGARVTVGEGDGGYGSFPADVAFDGHGLREICAAVGADLVNLSAAPGREEELTIRGQPYRLSLPLILLEETDLFVTLPVPKIHAMTHYSGAVKNQWGCIPDMMRLRRHPDFPELIWAVNERLRTRLVLGDAQYMLDVNGPMAGEAVYMNRVVGADDILAFDVTVTKHLMGLDPEQIPYLRLGRTLGGYAWGADDVEDRSTGPHHHFHLKRTLRTSITAAAFPRQWAVNLMWFSPLGDVAHRLLYFVRGNPLKRERARAEAMTQRRREQHRQRDQRRPVT